MNNPRCAVEECARPYRCRGFCALHYDRFIKTGKVGPTERLTQPARGRTCSVHGCVAAVRAKGLCASHYDRGVKGAACPRCGARKHKRSALCDGCRRDTFVHRADTKLCPGCGETKPNAQFGWRSSRSGLRLRSRCRTCAAEASRHSYALRPAATRKRSTREWERRNPEKHRMQQFRRRARMVGVPEQYVARVAELMRDSIACAICQRPFASRPADRRLHVDHCHKTNRIRGLICQGCNLGIGQLGDDPERLLAAAHYLRTADLLAQEAA